MITLSTPFNPGDVDPGQTYAQVLIDSFTIYAAKGELHINCCYGNGASAATFVPGKVHPMSVIIRDGIGSPDFSTIVGTSYPLSVDERLYDGAGRVLYQWLIDNVTQFSGGTVS